MTARKECQFFNTFGAFAHFCFLCCRFNLVVVVIRVVVVVVGATVVVLVVVVGTIVAVLVVVGRVVVIGCSVLLSAESTAAKQKVERSVGMWQT